MKRRYRRYFIILEGEDSGYEVSGSQSPKGHAKVEITNGRGSIVLNCQNLKSLEEKRMRYRWYLVNTNKNEPTVVDIGPMEIDENGKGEVVWEFNGENVNATKETIEEFNLLTLLVESYDDKKNLVAPLVGYIDKEKSQWRGLLEEKLYGKYRAQERNSIDLKKTNSTDGVTLRPKEEVENLTPKDKVELRAEIEVQPGKETQIEITEETQIEITEETQIEITEETQLTPKTELVQQPESLLVNDNIQNNLEETIHRIKEQDNDIIDKKSINQREVTKGYKDNPYAEGSVLKALQSYIESTVKIFPKVNPFEEVLENYHWWHIYYNYQTIYRAHMPFIAYIDGMKHPTHFYSYQYPSDYQRQIYQYQHYIFGIVYDEKKEAKYYVYGIPGKKIKTEQPYGGSTGFEYWKPSPRGAVDENTQGYWLLHIDPKTGSVIRPLKETKSL